ncbi:hypothetical protein [Agarivorans sp. JK6]|uniref:hypothetical protein n=1 Tax=Agarivorans sp. JK6 TaxID=2997426 RepID=UPI003872E25F
MPVRTPPLPAVALSLEDIAALLQKTLTTDVEPAEVNEIVETLLAMPEQTAAELALQPRLNSAWVVLKEEFLKVEQLGWNNWFERLFTLEQAPSNYQSLYHESLEHNASWHGDSFDAEAIEALLGQELPEEAGTVLRNSLPTLLEWLKEHELRCGHGFWCAVLELLALDNAVSDQDLRLAYMLLEQLVQHSFTRESYAKSLDALSLIADGVSSKTFDYALDIVELLLESKCPDTDARREHWQFLQAEALDKWSRLTLRQQHFARLLANQLLGDAGDQVSLFTNRRAKRKRPICRISMASCLPSTR